MDGAHLHLILTHVPVLGTIFGLIVLLYAALRNRTESARVALLTFVVVGAVAGTAYLTGESAEEAVEGQPGVSEAVIERHENAADVALGSTIVLGVAAVGGLLLARRGLGVRAIAVPLVAIAFGVSGVMAWTANLGGQINHPEIRAAGGTTQVEGLNGEGGDDD
jgi:FtsH-binding integral membrane protein